MTRHHFRYSISRQLRLLRLFAPETFGNKYTTQRKVVFVEQNVSVLARKMKRTFLVLKISMIPVKLLQCCLVSQHNLEVPQIRGIRNMYTLFSFLNCVYSEK